jgi:hypothetical protein
MASAKPSASWLINREASNLGKPPLSVDEAILLDEMGDVGWMGVRDAMEAMLSKGFGLLAGYKTTMAKISDGDFHARGSEEAHLLALRDHGRNATQGEIRAAIARVEHHAELSANAARQSGLRFLFQAANLAAALRESPAPWVDMAGMRHAVADFHRSVRAATENFREASDAACRLSRHDHIPVRVHLPRSEENAPNTRLPEAPKGNQCLDVPNSRPGAALGGNADVVVADVGRPE